MLRSPPPFAVVEAKPWDLSVMFQVLNSGDVWLPEPGIGHALPMSLEAGGGEEPFSQTDARCLGWAARHVGAVQERGVWGVGGGGSPDRPCLFFSAL